MDVTLVTQDDEYGCVVACLAMVTGRSYEEVNKDFENDFRKKGVPIRMVPEYLGDHGYSVIRKTIDCYVHKDFGREEMLRPFAPVHIINLKGRVDQTNFHAVVMDGSGKLLCPDGMTDEDIRQAYLFSDVFGIFKN